MKLASSVVTIEVNALGVTQNDKIPHGGLKKIRCNDLCPPAVHRDYNSQKLLGALLASPIDLPNVPGKPNR